LVKNTTTGNLLHTGRGFVHGILASVDASGGGTTGSVTIYDNTLASGNILFRANLHYNSPLFIQLDKVHVLNFETGCMVVTTAYVDAFILTEF
jgi:hypothetical protein